MSLAAKLRVVEFEVPDVQRRASGIFDEWFESGSRPFPLEWYESSHLRVLQRAIVSANAVGVTTRSVREALLAKAIEKRAEPTAFVKQNFQHEAYLQLFRNSPEHQNVHDRLRTKLKRWPSNLVARLQADRAQSLLKRLGQLVRPRVLSAVWRTLWNAWCTQRRFQKDGACLFNCGEQARDCIEHYAFCAVFRTFRVSLQLPAATRLDDFLLLSHPQWSDDRLILEAIALFCVYTCHNMARTSDQAGSESWVDSMDRPSFHAVYNHRRSAAALSTVWSQKKQFFARRTGQA